MRESLMLVAAFACCTAGLAWLALAMDSHWRQLRGSQPLARRTAVVLRLLGTAALVASLVLCLLVDHVSIAFLVWIMWLAAGALVVAFILAWRPRILAPLLACARAGK